MKTSINFLRKEKKKQKEDKKEKEKVCSWTKRPQAHNHFLQSYSG